MKMFFYGKRAVSPLRGFFRATVFSLCFAAPVWAADKLPFQTAVCPNGPFPRAVRQAMETVLEETPTCLKSTKGGYAFIQSSDEDPEQEGRVVVVTVKPGQDYTVQVSQDGSGAIFSGNLLCKQTWKNPECEEETPACTAQRIVRWIDKNVSNELEKQIPR